MVIKLYKALICLFFLLFRMLPVFGQTTISLAQQQEDFRIFRTGVQEMHAGLYWFISPKQMEHLYDSVYNSLKDDASQDQFYMKVRYCLAALKHGHDNVILSSGWDVPKQQLPFILRYLNDRLFIKVNCSGNKLIPNGSEIIAINGKPLQELTREFLSYSFTNGKNTSFPYQKLGTFMEFQQFLNSLYPSEKYTIDIIPPGQTQSLPVTVPIGSYQTMSVFYKEQTGRALNDWNPRGITYKLLDADKKIGYLEICTFRTETLESKGGKLENQLDRIFQKISDDQVEHLVVDIRNNGGGDDSWRTITSYFRGIPEDKAAGLPYLQSDRFTQLKYVERNDENRQILADFEANPYQFLDKTEDGRFRLKAQYIEHDTRARPLRKNAFQKKLYLLQNGLTFSASTAFAEKLRELTKKEGGFMKVIGEENGNDVNAGVGSGGFDVTLVLPHSKVRTTISLLGGGLAVPYSAPPIQFLDYKVVASPLQCVAETDVELAFVQELISKQ